MNEKNNVQNGIEVPIYIKNSIKLENIQKEKKIINFSVKPEFQKQGVLKKGNLLKNLKEKMNLQKGNELLDVIKDQVVNERQAQHKEIDELEKVIDENNRVFLLRQKTIRDLQEETDDFMIHWELGLLKQELRKEIKMELLPFLKELMKKADSILRMYIRMKIGQKQIISDIPNFKHFTGLNRKISYPEAHLLIIVSIINSNDGTIAQARPIKRNDDNRAFMGLLEINLVECVKQNDSQISIQRFLLTLVHEIFHILAFNKTLNPEEILKNKKENSFQSPNYYENLEFIADEQKNLSKAYQDGHWNESLLPQDFMTAYSRKNQILTIYTLEMIENFCHNYQTLPENLPSNWFFDSIDSKIDFLNYQCEDEDKPKYSSYCSVKQHSKKQKVCSGDYIHKTQCSYEKQANNCYMNVAMDNGTCIDSTLQSKNQKYEYFGIDSRCTETDQGISLCLQYRFEEIRTENQQTKIEIYVSAQGQEFHCEESGQQHSIGKIKLENGKTRQTQITCPNLEKFIIFHKKTNCPDSCHNNGFCSDGKCICYDGFEENTNCKTTKNFH